MQSRSEQECESLALFTQLEYTYIPLVIEHSISVDARGIASFR
jgi:hypothetical protein